MKLKSMRCVKCGSLAKQARMKFQGHEIEGWRCKCGEQYYEPEQAERILLLNKLRKKQFRLKLGRIKSNLIVRVPKEIETALNLDKSKEMVLSLKERGVQLVPA